MRISIAGILTVVLTVLALFSLTGYQITTQTAAERLLGRIGAALIELDRWLPAHRDDIELLARDRPAAEIVLPDLPLRVTVPSMQALEADDDTLHESITRAMGRQLYSEGAEALQDEQGESHLPMREPVRWTIGLLGESAHDVWMFASIAAGVALLGVLAAQVLSGLPPSFLALAVGGVIAAFGALGAWLLTGVFHTGFESAIDEEMVLILRDGAWIGLRNSIALTAIALAAFYIVRSLGWRRDVDGWDEWDEPDDFPRYEQPPPPRY